MNTIEIRIDLTSDVFRIDPECEVARILEDVAGQMRQGDNRLDSKYKVMDYNGNTCGAVIYLPAEEEDLGNCCQKHNTIEPHSCPYAEDIHGNLSPSFCRCCDNCIYQCQMDI